MRAVWISRYGPPEVLELRNNTDPEPQPGQVRLRVKAAGLNFAEVTARQGLYPDAPKPPCVVGYEVAGVIDAMGANAGAFQVGDRVIALCKFGGHADTVVVPCDQVRVMPASMSFEEAAALPVNYITAYHMLFRIACVRPKERVLVHMAAGGVGTAVLQLAQAIGEVTVFGTASLSKHNYIRSQGCTYPIDYHRDDYVSEVLRLTENEGVDVVLDPLGGRDWKKGYTLLREGGRLVAFGFANMSTGPRRQLWNILKQWFSMPRFSPLRLMDDNRVVAGVNLGHLWKAKHLLNEEIDTLLRFYSQGFIKPHIDAVFPLEAAADAHRYIESRKNVGKVLLIP